MKRSKPPMPRLLARAALALILAVLGAMPAMAQGVYPEIAPKDIAPAPVLNPGQELKPGDLFRDCERCPDMVVVPAGLFVMGSDKFPSEQPTRVIRFKKPFAITRFELTHDDWQACVDGGGCARMPDDHNWGRNRMPIINIDHAEATGFAAWLSKVTGHAYRMPSEAEWEYVARAGSKSDYWYGDDVGDNQVNCRKCGAPWSGIGNAPVGSFAPNPWGVYDMHGNAFEWVADCWHDNYEGAPKSAAAWTDGGDCRFRVIRGGSWYYYSRMSRSANRQKNPADVKSYWLSFRVVRDLP